jgi:hypothetical protein
MPSSQPDPATWLTTSDVSRQLGVKPRTVADLVWKERLHPVKYARPGMTGGAINLFDPAEVEALADERRAAKTEIVPAGTAVAPRPSMLLPAVRVIDSPVTSLPIDRKRYLTIEEAVAYTGLGEFYIHNNCQSWPIGPHRRAVYERKDLDTL